MARSRRSRQPSRSAACSTSVLLPHRAPALTDETAPVAASLSLPTQRAQLPKVASSRLARALARGSRSASLASLCQARPDSTAQGHLALTLARGLGLLCLASLLPRPSHAPTRPPTRRLPALAQPHRQSRRLSSATTHRQQESRRLEERSSRRDSLATSRQS